MLCMAWCGANAALAPYRLQVLPQLSVIGACGAWCMHLRWPVWPAQPAQPARPGAHLALGLAPWKGSYATARAPCRGEQWSEQVLPAVWGRVGGGRDGWGCGRGLRLDGLP
jgi:hypothetical protein